MPVNLLIKALEATGYHTAAQRTVLVEIAYRADRGGTIRHSQTEIATCTLLARRTVSGCFRDFVDCGLLTKNGQGRYTLDVPLLESGDLAVLLLGPSTWADEAELERLRATKRPDQGIFFTQDGHPYLADL